MLGEEKLRLKMQFAYEVGKLFVKAGCSSTDLGTATEMYLFMENLTLYNNAGRNPNDDAPDSLALFGSEIIEENSKPQKATPVANIRNYL